MRYFSFCLGLLSASSLLFPLSSLAFSNMTPEEIITLTNAYRKEQGLKPLKMSKQLMAAAQERAKDMVKTGLFSHEVATTSPGVTWKTFIDKSGYPVDGAGENLAAMFNDSQGVMQGWKNSPTHNKNLLRDYEDIGVAIVPGMYQGKQTFYVVQNFGRPKPTAIPLPTQLPKPHKTAQPSPKKAIPPTKLQQKVPPIQVPRGKMSETTPQVIPNKSLPKKLSLG
jgi:hypothetical protein